MKSSYIPSTVIFVLLLLFVASSKSVPEWHQVYKGPREVSFRGISAVDDSVCWVSGSKGTILRTLDGGKNWENLPIRNTGRLDFRDIEAFGPDTAVVMSIGESSSSRIYRTENGGNSWTLVHQNSYEQGFYDAISFWDHHNGLLQGDPVDGRLYLLRTSNGGRTWDEVPEKDRPKMHEGEYAFAASGTQMIVAKNGKAWIGTGGTHARILRSGNYGKTWESTSTPIIQGEPSTGIFSISRGDKANLLAVGGDYTQPKLSGSNLIFSENNGSSWQLQDSSDLEYRSAIRYLPSPGIFIATGPSGSNYSINDGVDWHSIKGTGFHTLDVGIHNSRIVWAAGANGRIAKLSVEKINLR